MRDPQAVAIVSVVVLVVALGAWAAYGAATEAKTRPARAATECAELGTFTHRTTRYFELFGCIEAESGRPVR